MSPVRIGLRFKLILLLVVVLTVVFTSVTVVLVRQNTNALRENLTDRVTAFASLATKPIGDTFNLYRESGQIRIQQQVDTFAQLDSTVSNIAIVDVTGKVLYSNHDGPSQPVSEERAKSFEPVFVRNNGELVQVIQPYIEDTGQHRYSLVYDISNESINESIRSVVRSVLLLSLIFLVISVIAAYFALNYLFVRPLQYVSKLALQVSTGDLDKEIKIDRHDEISDLAKSVNAMADSLKADIKKLQEVDALKTEFMIISSHNLRTPITAIKGYLDLLNGMPIDEQTKKYVNVAAANTERLHVFVEDMLTVAQIESGKLDSGSQIPTNLNKLFDSIAAEVLPLAAEKEILLGAENCDIVLNIQANTAQLKTAVWNILDNALKFSSKGSQVVMKLATDGDHALISIQDSGIGIAPEEIPKLFTKFHRATDVMKYSYEGTGLGLYTAKLMVEAHHGTITVQSELGKGTLVTVALPLMPTHPSFRTDS